MQNIDRETFIYLNQYKELCANARAIDNKLFAFPATAFTFESLGLFFLFNKANNIGDFQKVIVAFILTIVFSGFLIQMIRFQLYLLNTEAKIEKLTKENIPELLDFKHFSDINSNKVKAPFYLRKVNFSSSNYVISVMYFVLTINIILVLYFAYPLLKSYFGV